MRDGMGVDIAGGQDHLKGKIVRIAHIGYAGPFDVITAISTLEMALHRFGQEIPLGRGVQKAEEILLEGWPASRIVTIMSYKVLIADALSEQGLERLRSVSRTRN